MKDLINRALNLGIGAALQSKEQIEKTVEDLVRKGEVSRAESSDVINDLFAKGQEVKRSVEAVVNERVQKMAGAQNYATKEQVEAIANRIELLEEKLLKHLGVGTGMKSAAHTEPGGLSVSCSQSEHPVKHDSKVDRPSDDHPEANS